jgi:argininosuccinate lyase
MSAVIDSLREALADAERLTALARAMHDVAAGTGARIDRRSAAEALVLALDYERQVRALLDRELTSRASMRARSVRSNLERFAEIVGTGADPVKAALIVREEEEPS